MRVLGKIEKPDILQAVQSAGIELRQRGRLWWALCPFHSEKTPSFGVNPEKQRWHCFGACGTGGDVVDFVMKFRGVSFVEAVRLLRIPGGLRGGSKQAEIDPQRERRWVLSRAFDRWAIFTIGELSDEIWFANTIDSLVEKPGDLEIPGLVEMYINREVAEHRLDVLLGDNFGAKIALFRSWKEASCHAN